MTRAEHLAWAKARALEYVEIGELPNAVASMGSDLGKHPETRRDPSLLMLGVIAAAKGDREEVRRWIEGFN
jgi:hypothetical protein